MLNSISIVLIEILKIHFSEQKNVKLNSDLFLFKPEIIKIEAI